MNIPSVIHLSGRHESEAIELSSELYPSLIISRLSTKNVLIDRVMRSCSGYFPPVYSVTDGLTDPVCART